MIFIGFPQESGGDNLAANFSRELADYIIYAAGFRFQWLWHGGWGGMTIIEMIKLYSSNDILVTIVVPILCYNIVPMAIIINNWEK